MKIKLMLTILVIIASFTSVCAEITPPSTMQMGIVTDLNRELVDSADVTLTNVNTSATATTQTNSQGFYATIIDYSSGDNIQVRAEDSTYYGVTTGTSGDVLYTQLNTLLVSPSSTSSSTSADTGSRGGAGAVSPYFLSGHVFLDDKPVPEGVEVIITDTKRNRKWTTQTQKEGDNPNFYYTTISLIPGNKFEVYVYYIGYEKTVYAEASSELPHPEVNVYLKSEGKPPIYDDAPGEEISGAATGIQNKIFEDINNPLILAVLVGILGTLALLIIYKSRKHIS